MMHQTIRPNGLAVFQLENVALPAGPELAAEPVIPLRLYLDQAGDSSALVMEPFQSCWMSELYAGRVIRKSPERYQRKW
ncbi:hypothetical protein WP1_028 [Pseudomonas phage WP1]